MNELRRGNVVLLKKPLADLICVVQEVQDGVEEVVVRYMDSPPKERVRVKRGDIIKLAEEQERELPKEFLSSITKQREVVFTPKKERKVKVDDEDRLRKKRLEEVMKGLDVETLFKLMEGGEI